MNGNQMFGATMYGQPYPPRIHGRIVSSLGEIGVCDVPTDGSMGWFPSHDGTCVWGKRWNPNGSIETVQYLPQPVERKDDGLSELLQRVSALEAAMASQGKEAVLESD